MIKEMTTRELIERKGGGNKRRPPGVVSGRQKEPELLATLRASFLEKIARCGYV
jgi:hypothetical protein